MFIREQCYDLNAFGQAVEATHDSGVYEVGETDKSVLLKAFTDNGYVVVDTLHVAGKTSPIIGWILDQRRKMRFDNQFYTERTYLTVHTGLPTVVTHYHYDI